MSEPFYADSTLEKVEFDENNRVGTCKFKDISGGPTVHREFDCRANSNAYDTDTANPICVCTAGFKASGTQCVLQDETQTESPAPVTNSEPPKPVTDSSQGKKPETPAEALERENKEWVAKNVPGFQERRKDKQANPRNCDYYNWPERVNQRDGLLSSFVKDLKRHWKKHRCSPELNLNTAVLEEPIKHFFERRPEVAQIYDWWNRAGAAEAQVEAELRSKNYHSPEERSLLNWKKAHLQADMDRALDFLGGRGKQQAKVKTKRPDRIELYFKDQRAMVLDDTKNLDYTRLTPLPAEHTPERERQGLREQAKLFAEKRAHGVVRISVCEA